MSNREVSTELAEAVIDLVRECQWNVESPFAADPWPHPQRGLNDWPEYVEDVKPAIAKVLDLLMEEVVDDIIAIVQREQGWRDD